MPDTSREHVFELGLVMAGAISAGAYTAGVVDFLLEALDRWQTAKAKMDQGGPPVLRHGARLSVLAGASAGGMTAAALTAALSGTIRPVNTLRLDGPAPAGNPLYDCWVESIGIEDFLGTSDLGSRRVESLLNCAKLDQIASTHMLPQPGPAPDRPYVADDLHVFVTLANLRGTPYKIPFKGEGGYGHPMNLHKDYAHFVYCKKPSNNYSNDMGDFPQYLDPAAPGAIEWDFFKTAALATGAFPLALAPRKLDRYLAEYRQRKWLIPDSVALDPATGNLKIEASEQAIDLDAALLAQAGTQWRKTLNVDGGTFDNEPLELGRRQLAGKELVNPRAASKACRAVVLVDPFPQSADDPVQAADKPDVLTLAVKILGAMKSNARFKPDELVLAQAPDCYSRFIIGPTREGKASRTETDIACGALGGFSGFFSNKFRRHDFQLGRRNCQRFLSHHFIIPLKDADNNHLFDLDKDKLEQFAVTRQDDQGKAAQYVPIIPLMSEIDPDKGHEEKALPWSDIILASDALEALRRPIVERVKAVAGIYLGQYIGNALSRMLAGWLLGNKYDEVADWLLGKVRADFTQNGLMR